MKVYVFSEFFLFVFRKYNRDVGITRSVRPSLNIHLSQRDDGNRGVHVYSHVESRRSWHFTYCRLKEIRVVSSNCSEVCCEVSHMKYENFTENLTFNCEFTIFFLIVIKYFLYSHKIILKIYVL